MDDNRIGYVVGYGLALGLGLLLFLAFIGVGGLALLGH